MNDSPPIRLEWVNPNVLDENPRNWRTHPDVQVKALDEAIARVGWVQPLLFNERTNRLVDGHARRKIALAAGTDMVPVIYGSWSEEEEAYILLTLDPIGAMAGRDKTNLEELLNEVNPSAGDGVRTMFEELARQSRIVLGQLALEGMDPDALPEAVPAVTEAGDLWILGDHRIVCGDSTDQRTIDLVLNGDMPELIVTDPPYGVDYVQVARSRQEGKGRHWDDIAGDNLDREGLRALLVGAIRPINSPAIFCWHGWRRVADFAAAIEQCGYNMDGATEIVWVKNAAPLSRGDYHWRHECCIFAKRTGVPAQVDRTQTTVWEFDRPRNSDHPTQKPVGLYERAFRNHTHPGELVYDPFLGSGTAVVAAELTGRRARGIELDPKYCDLTVKRWETATGREGVRVRGALTASESSVTIPA